MLNFVTKYWKWIAVAVAAILLLSWVNSRAQLTGKLWGMLFQEIKDDREAIEKDLVGEINRLVDEKEGILKKLTILQADKDRLQKEKESLQNEKINLQNKLDTLVVPSQPNAIVDSLRELGLGSARARPRNLP